MSHVINQYNNINLPNKSCTKILYLLNIHFIIYQKVEAPFKIFCLFVLRFFSFECFEDYLANLLNIF